MVWLEVVVRDEERGSKIESCVYSMNRLRSYMLMRLRHTVVFISSPSRYYSYFDYDKFTISKDINVHSVDIM